MFHSKGKTKLNAFGQLLRLRTLEVSINVTGIVVGIAFRAIYKSKLTRLIFAEILCRADVVGRVFGKFWNDYAGDQFADQVSFEGVVVQEYD